MIRHILLLVLFCVSSSTLSNTTTVNTSIETIEATANWDERLDKLDHLIAQRKNFTCDTMTIDCLLLFTEQSEYIAEQFSNAIVEWKSLKRATQSVVDYIEEQDLVTPSESDINQFKTTLWAIRYALPDLTEKQRASLRDFLKLQISNVLSNEQTAIIIASLKERVAFNDRRLSLLQERLRLSVSNENIFISEYLSRKSMSVLLNFITPKES